MTYSTFEIPLRATYVFIMTLNIEKICTYYNNTSILLSRVCILFTMFYNNVDFVSQPSYFNWVSRSWLECLRFLDKAKKAKKARMLMMKVIHAIKYEYP